jgi:hypothetical protein
LENGVNIKAVSKRLLHATVGITENLYVHVTPHMQEKCVAVMDEKITPHLQKLGLCVQNVNQGSRRSLFTREKWERGLDLNQ